MVRLPNGCGFAIEPYEPMRKPCSATIDAWLQSFREHVIIMLGIFNHLRSPRSESTVPIIIELQRKCPEKAIYTAISHSLMGLAALRHGTGGGKIAKPLPRHNLIDKHIRWKHSQRHSTASSMRAKTSIGNYIIFGSITSTEIGAKCCSSIAQSEAGKTLGRKQREKERESETL